MKTWVLVRTLPPCLEEARRRWGSAAIIKGLGQRKPGTRPATAPRSPLKPAPSAA